MRVLHVTASLEGRVGRAHAALAAAMPLPARQSWLLLHEPRDRQYADEIIRLGRKVELAGNLDDVAERAAEADIVQFDFCDHPKLFECLARTAFPPMRTVFWSHVTGLSRPVIPPGLLLEAGRFAFSTPASLEVPAVQVLPGESRSRLAVIGRAYGFEGEQAAAGPQKIFQVICLVGSDPDDLHPGFFEAVDTLAGEVKVALWGSADEGSVAVRLAGMRHPQRIRFMGPAGDRKAALSQSSILFLPLQGDDCGDDVLVEAMSLGVVPVVLAGPLTSEIIRQGQTGFLATSVRDCADILAMLLADPALVERVGAEARKTAATAFSAKRAARRFVDLWTSLMTEEKRLHDFQRIIETAPSH